MLTLDAPDRFRADAAPQAVGPTSTYEEAFRLMALASGLRDAFSTMPASGSRLDPDRLYHAHGDPRD